MGTEEMPIGNTGDRLMGSEVLLKDAIENAKAQTALEAAINSLSQEVKRLTVTVEKNNEKLERLSALESSHNNTSNALERAFKAISELEADIASTIENNAHEHRAYDRYIWMCVGFATAISVVWSVMGYRMNSMIDKNIESIARMEAHIQQDKMIDDHDVKSIIDSYKK